MAWTWAEGRTWRAVFIRWIEGPYGPGRQFGPNGDWELGEGDAGGAGDGEGLESRDSGGRRERQQRQQRQQRQNNPKARWHQANSVTPWFGE